MNGLVCIGLDLCFMDEDLLWVESSKCEKLHHFLCFEIHDPEDIGEENYYPDC